MSTIAKLPWFETAVYFFILATFLSKFSLSLYETSTVYGDVIPATFFRDGWTLIGGWKQDNQNWEWEFWRDIFVRFLPWIGGFLGLTVVTSFITPKKSLFIRTIYSMCAYCYVMGVASFSFLCAHIGAMYLISLTRNRALCGLTMVVLVCSLNSDWYRDCLQYWIDDEEYLYYLGIFTTAMNHLRTFSYVSEYCMVQESRSNKKQIQSDTPPTAVEFSFTLLLEYVFYLPTFYTGPLMNYDTFYVMYNSPRAPWTRRRIFSLLVELLKVLFWCCVIEIILSLFYFNAIMITPRVFRKIDNWTLIGLGWINGQFFQLKYVVFYGLPRVLARLDGVYAPEGPRCVMCIHQYSDMWKYFDRGLYNFMSKYIYGAFGGSRHGIVRQMFAYLCSFLFIFCWHGGEWYVFCWCTYNYLGISAEMLGKTFLPKTSIYNKISPPWRRRIGAFICVPQFALSLLAIFAFFGGVHFSDVFYKRFISEADGMTMLVVYGAIYVMQNVAMETDRWRQLREEEHSGKKAD